ncbi:MAG: LacI family DNA-binding transcriptional regulator [Muribaculaceae bacterium]|nr:LacI family DNA-binding transcriptional regulator [Muribaculaceae bacterium]
MEKRPPMTMKDIARALGVSVATVSRALSDSPSISKDRRKAIQQFAAEHNYYPNELAGQLRQSRKSPIKVIGVIVPQFLHYYFASVLTGIEQEASSRGYTVIVAQSHEQYEQEVRICDSFHQGRVCGVIVSQAKDTERYDHFVRLIDQGVPLVFYDRICAAINAHRVVVDDYMGAYRAVSYLIEHGCKRIAYYGTNLNMEIGINRYNGYKDALYKHGLKPDDSLVRMCDSRELAEQITPVLLKRKDRPDAIFAVNDVTAVAALHVAKRMGLDVPRDLSICGFTNDETAVACDPKLTTVEQRGVEVGRQAVDVLLGLVEGRLPIDHAEKRVVKTRLVVRGTTRNDE